MRLVVTFLRTAICAAALSVCLAAAWAQDDGLAPPGQAHDRGVYLADSFEAEELIGQALDSAERGEWPRALAKLDQTVQQYGRRVISDADGIYVSVYQYVGRLIAGWPAAGLHAYRAQHEAPAAQAFEQAAADRDLRDLSKAYHAYFATETAVHAGDLLAQLLIEQGAFEKAQAIYENLLQHHPDRERHENAWRAQLVICAALAGELELARETLRAGGAALRQHEVTWRGTTAAVEAIVDELEDNPVAPVAALVRDNWPTLGGNARRTGVAQCDIVPSAPLWIFEDFAPSTLAGADGYFQSSTYRSALNHGKFLALQPVVADGVVYFSDAHRVWAVSTETGSLLWRYEGPAPVESNGGWGDRSVPALHGCTVFEDQVFVELGQRPVSYYGYQPPRNHSVVACLEAASGREVWKVSPQDFGEDPREVQFEGPVVVDRHGAYVMVRRRKAFGFEDAYLWGLGLDGTLKWRAHLASASTGGFGYRRPTLSVPTLVDGTLYVQTNLGAFAAVDVLNGIIDWISVYGHAQPEQLDRWQRSDSKELFPWHYSAMLPIPGRRLLAVPLDSEKVFIVDRKNGALVHHLPASELFEVQMLLGRVGDQVWGVGDQLFAWNAATFAMTWSQDPPPTPLYGRGTVSRTRLFVPAHDGLYSYPLRGGEPQVKKWEAPQEGGNVVVLSDHIVVAGNERVTCYALRDNVFTRLQTRMAERPGDVQAALDLAEVAYRTAAAQTDPAQKESDYLRGHRALNEAVSRAGGFAAVWDESVQARLFQDCLQFAGFHLKEQPPQVQQAVDLLVMAGLCPPDSPSLLLQKVRLARAYAAMGDHANEVLQYHQIMADRSLRELPWPESAEDAAPARVECTARIADRLRRHGRQIYKAIDEQASNALAAALQAEDIDRLDRIIEVTPNSRAAPEALLAKGRLLRERMEQPMRAARCFYSALTRYAKVIDQADAVRQIADCYARAGRPALAWQWLTKGGREHPHARLQVGDSMLSFMQYRERLGRIDHLLASPVPQVGPPLQEAFSIELAGDWELLEPRFSEHPQACWAHFLIYREGTVRAFQALDGRPLWRTPLAVHEKPQLLASFEEVLVLATRFELVGLHPTSGEQLWKHGQVPEDLELAETDPEAYPYWRLHDLRESLLVSARSDGQVLCVDVADGQVRWSRTCDPPPIQAINVGERLVIYRGMSGERQVFPVLSVEDGTPQQVIEVAEQRPVMSIVDTPAGNVLLISSQSLVAVDPLSGRTEWQAQFDHNFLIDSVRVVLDGAVLCPDGQHVIKLSLDTGGQMWRSDPLARRPTDVYLFTGRDELYAVREGGAVALDAVSGRTLGVLLPPRGGYLSYFDLLDPRLLLISRSTPDGGEDPEHRAYFIERPLQTDRQLEARDGLLLGPPAQTVRFYARDRAIIAAFDDALRGWVGSPISGD